MSAWMRHPAVIVTLCAGLIALWIGSGLLGREAPRSQAGPDRELQVAVMESVPRLVEQRLTFQGQIRPVQVVHVRAETSGQVAALEQPRGARVAVGDVLLRLDPGERHARLREQEAELARARRDYEANRALTGGGFATELRVDAARASMHAAEAALEATQRDLDRTTVRAPIDGILESRLVERGEWVSTGEALAELVDNDPLLAVAQVPQHMINQIRPGGAARVRPVGSDTELAGEITYVSRLADAATRTFRVEIELPNPDDALPAGTSARVVIPVAEVLAHQVSPAVLGLDDQGRPGLKTVDDDQRVQFHPVRVIRADSDGLWVTGPEGSARIITAGAAFVSAGERVQVAGAAP